MGSGIAERVPWPVDRVVPVAPDGGEARSLPASVHACAICESVSVAPGATRIAN
jgi:hypothetical protein